MRDLSKRATTALLVLCVAFALLITAVGVVGILGVRSGTHASSSITNDEVRVSTTTAQVAKSMDLVYATAERALLTTDTGTRTSLMNTLYAQLIPQVDSQLTSLQRLHAADPTGQFHDFQNFARQWRSVRNLLSTSLVFGQSGSALAGRLTTTYQPLSNHISGLIDTEQHDADADAARAASTGAMTTWTLSAAIALGLALCALLAWVGTRRIRSAVEPEQDQIDFAETLQIAQDEEEAHQLLQRHLERSVQGTTAVVFNRNNSADRLEAVTPLPAHSPLVESLRGAEPRSCLAVRSGRSHTESPTRPGLLACAVCSVCPGTSTCVPLTVGGEVIGSVLLNRESPYSEPEDQRIRESVSQAAPVLANLRNLAVAEIRAATDGLTGLPNKRAVTDTLKRMFAQAARTGSSLTLVLLDLDHFKRINDQLGHPIGDQVLANVGAVLRSSLRAGDFAGRNGGEEFALLLPDSEVSVGYEIAERVRAAIGDIALPGINVSVTGSFGVAAYPDHASTLERLERLADAALYVAKRSGRNRTEIADPAREAVALGDVALNGHAVDVPYAVSS
jgi:diguanylate cyclase (GGDEF)-like protein